MKTTVPLFTVALALSTMCISQAFNAQSLEPQPAHSDAGWAGSENRWRLGVTDSGRQIDPVAPSLRSQRNAQMLPTLTKLEEMEAGGRSLSFPSGSPPAIELSARPDATWVLASFQDYLVLNAKPSSDLLYTEMRFGITQVIKQPERGSVQSNSVAEVDRPGGRLRNSSGIVQTKWLTPSHELQPGHQYILGLVPSFEGTWSIHKYYDVTSGAVADRGSVLNNMTTAEAIAYLKTRV